MATTIHPDGTLVRVTGTSDSGDAELNATVAQVDAELVVYAYVSTDDRDNDDPNGKAYYLLDKEGSLGGTDWAYPENLKAVQSAAERGARRVPSIEDLTRAVSSSLHHGSGDIVEIDETDHRDAANGVIHAYGRAANGLRIGFRVRVDQIEETDL